MSGHYAPPDQSAHYFHPADGQPTMLQQQQQARPPQFAQLQSASSEHLRTQYVSFEQSAQPPPSEHGAARQRKRSAAGDHVKHRRTRSGCFTCRHRRVKCDETHPICDRCRKGNRVCEYPEPPSATKSKSKGKTALHESESSDDEPESPPKSGLPAIPDDEELPSSAPSAQAPQTAAGAHREPSKTPSLTYDKSPSPSTEDSVSIAFKAPPSAAPRGGLKGGRKVASQRFWHDLPRNVQFYINYYRSHVTHHHYAFKYDGERFLKGTILEIAIRYDPLLYAVTGFAAFHHTINKPDGKIQDFLGFYNKAVSLLLASIRQSPKHTIARLLTILQLATMEEFLGDWVNLMGHQTAAYNIIEAMFTPDSIMQNETSRKILQWYMRFDLFASILAGHECVLGREWFNTCHYVYVEQAHKFPDELKWRYEERLSLYRVLVHDMATLFGRKGKGAVTEEEFAVEVERLQQRINDWELQIDPRLLNERKLIHMSPDDRARDPDDIVDPYAPGVLYGDDIFSTNFARIDFWSFRIMFNTQLSIAQKSMPAPETMGIAYRMCQLFEALEVCPQSPPGAILCAHASLGIACMYLPKDERHTMWARRKLATIEAHGYIYATSFRERMSGFWNIDVKEWWLPNDEGRPPIVRAIREFILDRNAVPQSRTDEDVRDMKGLFSSMSLDDTPSSRLQQSPPEFDVFDGDDGDRHEGKGKGPEEDERGMDPTEPFEGDQPYVWNDSPEYVWAFSEEGYPGP